MQGISLQNQRAIRGLVNRVLGLERKSPSLVVNFAGCYSGDGVSMVLSSLSQYLISFPVPQRCLFVDINGSHPGLHENLGISAGPGLLNVLSGRISLEKAVHSCDGGNVSLLQFGEIEQGLGHCGSDTLAPVFERIRTQYPLVFIDSSTILNEPEAISGIRIADYTFLVITSGKVPAKAGIRTKQLIEANDGKIAGVILNKVKYEIPQWLYRFI